MYNAFTVQVRFKPEDIHFRTMTTMNRAARLDMMPDYVTLAVPSSCTLLISVCWAGPAINKIEMK